LKHPDLPEDAEGEHGREHDGTGAPGHAPVRPGDGSGYSLGLRVDDALPSASWSMTPPCSADAQRRTPPARLAGEDAAEDWGTTR
jgi:hypothetical protein